MLANSMQVQIYARHTWENPHPKHVTRICEAGKHCAPRYYCTDSNGRDIETLRGRDERL